jgi:hypothetical protein
MGGKENDHLPELWSLALASLRYRIVKLDRSPDKLQIASRRLSSSKETAREMANVRRAAHRFLDMLPTKHLEPPCFFLM